MTELTCIVCPKGCRLKVDEENGFAVTGASCQRGIVYGKKELTAPTRTVTSTVAIEGALVKEAVAVLKTVRVKAPVKTGDVIFENVLGTGADFIATKTMERV